MANVNSASSGKVTLALFGVGRIGPIHLKSIARHPRIRLKYLVEAVVDLATKALDDVGLEGVTILHHTEVAKVFEDKSIHGVVLCTPTSTHQSLITQAMRAGKAVFCEKPLALDSKTADECYKVAEECKLPLLCAFNRRFDPTYANIIQRARKGELGQVRYVKTTLRDTMDPNWEGLEKYLGTIASCWIDLAIHDVDLVCTVLGEFPTSISAQGGAFHEAFKKNNDFDQAIINLKFASGALATIEMSRFCNYGYDQRLEVFGLGGMLEGANFHDNHVVTANGDGVSMPKYQASFDDRYAESYYNELDHFIRVVQGKEEKICVTRKESVAALRICEAAEKANATDSIVKLEW
ncbi:inositol 2-dehydrogenase-like [Amphiura filiformis]|uniref:inositol 2-dehydrogenase-like n=1 Tax=Amphiura filiformis TaxID=82378 RepID=UPI003B21E670